MHGVSGQVEGRRVEYLDRWEADRWSTCTGERQAGGKTRNRWETGWQDSVTGRRQAGRVLWLAGGRRAGFSGWRAASNGRWLASRCCTIREREGIISVQAVRFLPLGAHCKHG